MAQNLASSGHSVPHFGQRFIGFSPTRGPSLGPAADDPSGAAKIAETDGPPQGAVAPSAACTSGPCAVQVDGTGGESGGRRIRLEGLTTRRGRLVAGAATLFVIAAATVAVLRLEREDAAGQAVEAATRALGEALAGAPDGFARARSALRPVIGRDLFDTYPAFLLALADQLERPAPPSATERPFDAAVALVRARRYGEALALVEAQPERGAAEAHMARFLRAIQGFQ